jgi:hypothetical protein
LAPTEVLKNCPLVTLLITHKLLNVHVWVRPIDHANRVTRCVCEKVAQNVAQSMSFYKKEVARGGERTWVFSISFIFSFAPLYS